jgi:pimeloyl-ACP methyl ester carboxylesterase
MGVRLIEVEGARLEVDEWGTGEPVVLIQTALSADDLLAVANGPALSGGFRKVVYHRRGYAGSSPAEGPGSVVREAADARALLATLGIERAHIVGVSYSAAIALQLAADTPQAVHTLTVAEPPPVHTSRREEFRARNTELVRTRQEQGVEAALEEFFAMLVGPGWRGVLEADLPGTVAQIERDAATFFDIDVPALLDWQFGQDQARQIRCPVLYLRGSDSGPWFEEVSKLVLAWLPHAEDAVVSGAGHRLQATHPSEVADALATFLRRHPM